MKFAILGLIALFTMIVLFRKKLMNYGTIAGVIAIILFSIGQQIDPPELEGIVSSVILTASMWIAVFVLVRDPIVTRVGSLETKIDSTKEVLSEKLNSTNKTLERIEKTLGRIERRLRKSSSHLKI